jgi:hypothetical protein
MKAALENIGDPAKPVVGRRVANTKHQKRRKIEH